MGEYNYNNTNVSTSKKSCTVFQTSKDTTSDTSTSSEDSASEDDKDDCYLAVRCDTSIATTEQDIICRRCESLAEYLRERPTLPANVLDTSEPLDHKDLPIQLPLYHCPFKGCAKEWESRSDFVAHFLDDYDMETMDQENAGHGPVIDRICGTDYSWMTRLDYVYGAVSVKERLRWPDAGLAVARRSLRNVVTRYNDHSVQCLVCFVCGSQQVTVDNVTADENKRPISYVNKQYFDKAEYTCPGTLLNNCSYDLWKARYVDTRFDNHTDDGIASGVRRDKNKPLRLAIEREQRTSFQKRWLDDWVLDVDICHWEKTEIYC